MKLTQGKLIETIRKKNQGWTTYQARKISGISIRRVNQVYKQYLLNKQIPEIGKKNGRSTNPTKIGKLRSSKKLMKAIKYLHQSLKNL